MEFLAFFSLIASTTVLTLEYDFALLPLKSIKFLALSTENELDTALLLVKFSGKIYLSILR
jgi:hypothetical protein